MNVEISLPRPGELVGALERLFKDALNVSPAGIRGNTTAQKLTELRERLHLGDFSRWKTGSLKYDRRRSGGRGHVRYPALEVTKRLIALLSGETYIDDDDKERQRADRELAKCLLQHWRRAEAQESVEAVLVLLRAHKEKIAEEIARLTQEAEAAKRRDLAEAAATASQVRPDRHRLLAGQDRTAGNRLGAEDSQHGPGGNPMAAGSASAVDDSNRDKRPSILRMCVMPFEVPSPRPVNLLMVLGVSRFAAIAVTIGIEASELAEDLIAVESMLRRIEGRSYATRTWDVGPPTSWGVGGARGAVWAVADGTTAEEIWRALATAFSRPETDCGNVLVMALPSDAYGRASTLLDTSIKALAAGALSAGASVPMYIWHSGASNIGAAEPLLGRIRSCVEAGECADDSTDVLAVFRMRLFGGATLAPEWDSADAEQIRLHDLSLSLANASRPGMLDETRAAELIARIQGNQNLLHALQFLPVSQKLLNLLASAPALTRAVAGLLTPAELQTHRPEWRRPMADGYRPAPTLPRSLEGAP